MEYFRTVDEYSIIRGKHITIDPYKFIVIVGEREIILYAKEFDVLYYLASHPGWVLSAEQIYQAVWHEDLCSCEHVIYNTISQIRKKLGIPGIIKTVKGRGYKYVGVGEV